MYPRVFDDVQREKEKAMAKFNRFRMIAKLWKFLEVLVVLGVMSWSAGSFPAVLKVTCGCLVEFVSNCLSNHHVVFLIGNAIIVLLLMLCRQNDACGNGDGDGGDFYDDYVKYSEVVARQGEPALPHSPVVEEGATGPIEESGGVDGEKQIVVRAQEKVQIPQCDDVAVAIEKARRLIQRFQRTQSEKLKREISVKRRPELRRSETVNHVKTVSSRPAEVSEIENLSNEEFRRRVDAFIDKHWSGKGTKSNQFGEYENYALLKMS